MLLVIRFVLQKTKKTDTFVSAFRFHKSARRGARGPVDLGPARTGAERRLRTHACLHGFVSTRAHKKIRVGFPTNSHFFLERETGLEPAASTLARSRSTN